MVFKMNGLGEFKERLFKRKKLWPFFLACVGLVLLFPLVSPRAHAYANEFSPPQWVAEPYRPNYFLYGSQTSKLQLGAKIQLIQDLDLYFAYTQLMFWDLGANSKPFYDLNYNPEFFYRIRKDRESSSWIDLGFYEHESNGLEEEKSRSWDRSYIRYVFMTPISTETKLYTSLKAWFAYGSYDDGNRDIQRYRGIWEANFTLTQFLGSFFGRHDLTLRIYPGGASTVDPLKGGQELTFRYVRASRFKILPVISFQIFNGYAEKLIDYDKRHTEFRVGISF